MLVSFKLGYNILVYSKSHYTMYHHTMYREVKYCPSFRARIPFTMLRIGLGCHVLSHTIPTVEWIKEWIKDPKEAKSSRRGSNGVMVTRRGSKKEEGST